ncbi:hypothetical protein [Bacillus sp. P14.5]|uniref:hypothetical protein n=1 Tax=Bacillus sp. P14.5 TaxID=1983400 RepID=UPI000DE8EF8F|nr:hypothetical protein [Bacillus sp. P14.5]
MKWKIWLLSLFFFLSGCSSIPDLEEYNGKSLRIGVIGDPPEVREENITFSEIAFHEIENKTAKEHDAIFVTKEHLYQASEGKSSEVYLNSAIPVFFIESSSHIPFTVDESEFGQNWEWSPGNNFAVGIFSSTESDSLNSWGYGLYNDEKTNEHVKGVFSRIFTTIEELK